MVVFSFIILFLPFFSVCDPPESLYSLEGTQRLPVWSHLLKVVHFHSIYHIKLNIMVIDKGLLFSSNLKTWHGGNVFSLILLKILYFFLYIKKHGNSHILFNHLLH